ncbi:FxSxx-COOH system tetratricopeptide repeat protein [Streptomyces sp. NPDC057456]|uniref:FxSxx-COOH system tetratricopeptide repeat protein n=1 Tax=Streptomyces sp. NPDC057456 TaxID=3346139 RepID=UPI0036865864
MPFDGAGFPAFAAESGSGQSRVEYFKGHLPPVSTAGPGWVLDCEVWPANREGVQRPWAGASGSAVFCRDRLVGVAIEDNRAMGWRRLHAVPIHEAMSLPDFAELVTRHGHPGTSSAIEEVAADPASQSGKALTWPVEVGPIPALATAFQPRDSLRRQIDDARHGGGTVVLTQVLSGGGGVGKTQLAAAYAAEALQQGVDLVVWVPSASMQQVTTRYAETARRLQLPGTTGQNVQDARVLLDWLATTSRRWLVVLDDVCDDFVEAEAVRQWWPASRTGASWVLATSRLNDARMTGGGRTRVSVDVYRAEESSAYLRSRVGGDDMSHLIDDSAPALAVALGHLPLALSLAAAYIINEGLPCTDYLSEFEALPLIEALPPEADTEGYGQPITKALLLCLGAVQAADRNGLALPALRLIAHLDPAGHPQLFWVAARLLEYLGRHRATPPSCPPDTPEGRTTPGQAHSALRLLHRYALLTYDIRAEPRAVRIHALTARAVREETPAPELPALAKAAADTLLGIWPEVDQHHGDLAAVLRSNTETLAHHAGSHLWDPGAHAVLFRAGTSLLDAGLANSAITWWRGMTADSSRSSGGAHGDAFASWANLASSYWLAGQTQEAIEIEEQLVADAERLFGLSHPETLTLHNNLAASYKRAGRNAEALAMEERVVADCERVLGNDHPNTLTVRGNLADSYRQAGRVREALELEEQLVADCERVLGADDPYTLAVRDNLADSYRKVGRTREALVLLEQLVSDSERLLGDDHPRTLIIRSNLALSLSRAGRVEEALALEERLVADSVRLRGPDHPNTLTVRGNLADSYRQAGRVREALQMQERLVSDSDRVLGEDHPQSIIARANLAGFYGRHGHTVQAIVLLQQLLTASNRLHGAAHPDTLAIRFNLGVFYSRQGRVREAVDLLEQAAFDSERLLGPDHPDTLAIRDGLDTVRQRAIQDGEGQE